MATSAVSVKVDLRQFKRLESNMRGLQKSRIMRKAAKFLVDELKNNPPTKAQGAFSSLATPKQKRAFWAKVRRGQARVDGQGYVRTGTTSGAWNVAGVAGFKAIAENASPAAYFVYGQKGQQPFHAKSEWQRQDKFANKMLPEVNKIIEAEVRKELLK